MGQSRPPLITRYATWLMGRAVSYSSEKARTRLGWSPAYTFEDGLRETVAWYRQWLSSRSTD